MKVAHIVSIEKPRRGFPGGLMKFNETGCGRCRFSLGGTRWPPDAPFAGPATPESLSQTPSPRHLGPAASASTTKRAGPPDSKIESCRHEQGTYYPQPTGIRSTASQIGRA